MQTSVLNEKKVTRKAPPGSIKDLSSCRSLLSVESLLVSFFFFLGLFPGQE